MVFVVQTMGKHGFHKENIDKTMGNMVFIRETLRKPGKYFRKTRGNLSSTWEYLRNSWGKPEENLRRTDGKPEGNRGNI